MTIECVTIETNHLFYGNPIAGQHRLRYASIVQRQEWDVPAIRAMEYDGYDTPATTYLVWRDPQYKVRGCSRLCPTDRPFMLKDVFADMVTYQTLPEGQEVWEGSRFCIDKNLDRPTRERIAKEIVVAYLEHGLACGVTQILGVMYPVYWRNLFEKNGWQPRWIGEVQNTPDGKKSRAAILELSEAVLARVRENTGIHEPILSYGTQKEQSYAS